MSGRPGKVRTRKVRSIEPAAYTPLWVAQCYGVTVNDECPAVVIEPDASEDPRAEHAWQQATRRAALIWVGMDPDESWENDHGIILGPLLKAWERDDEAVRDRFLDDYLNGRLLAGPA